MKTAMVRVTCDHCKRATEAQAWKSGLPAGWSEFTYQMGQGGGFATRSCQFCSPECHVRGAANFRDDRPMSATSEGGTE